MSFLIPIGVVFYAAIGGLKATFTTSYMHTVIVFVICLYFMFKVTFRPCFSWTSCLARHSINCKGAVQFRVRHTILRVRSWQCKHLSTHLFKCGVSSISVKFICFTQVFIPGDMLGGMDDVRRSLPACFATLATVCQNVSILNVT